MLLEVTALMHKLCHRFRNMGTQTCQGQTATCGLWLPQVGADYLGVGDISVNKKAAASWPTVAGHLVKDDPGTTRHSVM